MTGAITFEHVTKRYPAATQPAVDDVSLEVPHGSLVVLLGPSGCGKTTLLKMVNRLQEHDLGRVLVDGKDVRSFQVNDLRRGIGYTIQSVGLFPHMTVARNIATVPEMLRWDKPRIEERIDSLLELVGLDPGEYRHRYPEQLSGGQQQRVGLARALAADPAILLMDEPFAAIDSITRRRLQDELLDIQARLRKTVLFVTHDVEEAIRLGDRIAVMRLGRVVQYDTPLNILSKPADEFVASLVGAGDVLRRLSLLSVRSAMCPPAGRSPADRGAVLDANSTLREALGLLLSTGAEWLSVRGPSGEEEGIIDLSSIKSAVFTD
ncbi:MAG: ABC transporter ATP-binding protein [Chloroflexota bacterium]|nr:ABC transporter ATP-binding protein [Chloroflexota bacterium]MDQ5864715.1 ABC transporter ATP-binding protein [Chloroflexota bacterium]